jgi:glycine cleavage system H protein
MANDTKKFTSTHEWLAPIDDDMVVGITFHAQQLLGDLVFVELPEIGHQVKAGDELGVVESVKAASDFYAPISGTITAVNEKVRQDVALINQSPEEDGWLVKIKANNPNELAELLDSDQYQRQIAQEH